MRLRRTRQAENDLLAIADYGYENFGEDRATAYVDELEKRCRELVANPALGRTEPLLGKPMRSLSSASHRIYYLIEGDEVVLYRILHKSMDVLRHLD
jgi:toxin ParE1/3/4